MEQRLANTWRMTLIEKKFIQTALLSELRIDGRGPFDYRNVNIQFGSEDGSSEVQLGQTRVMGFVTCQLVQPYRDRPNEGTLAIFTEFSPMADPSFEAGRPGEYAVELGRIIDRGLRESRAVDTESLCVISGKWVWSIRMGLHIIDNCGNLVDAANIAALAALLTFRRPECSLGGEDGQEVIIHPPEVSSRFIDDIDSDATDIDFLIVIVQSVEVREPVPLIVHHLPIAVTFAFIGNESTVVLDPSHFEEAVMGGKLTATLNANGDVCAIQKAGGEGVLQSGIMQCLRIASSKAADMTGKIKDAVDLYNTGRALRKIKQHPDSVDVSIAVWKGYDDMPKEMDRLKLEIKDRAVSQTDGMEIEIHSSEKDGSSFGDTRSKPFISGPSIWDPYSKGVNAEELKATLASRAAVPQPKMDASPPIELQSAARDQSIEESDLPSSPWEPAKGGVQLEAKTLKDAVKPKHLRKKKNLPNSVGVQEPRLRPSMPNT